MMVLKRLRSFALSRAGTHLFYAFSSTQPVQDKLSDAGQQAVWAHYIIKLIQDADSYPLKLTDPSILDKIKKLNIPKTTRFESAFNQKDGKYANRDEVVKMMIDGILLNPIVFTQIRVQQAKQQKEFHSAGNLPLQQSYNGNFIFYPNYLGTSVMFNTLDKKVQPNFLITGGFGISKTISIIFYIHLSNFITKYAVQCSKNPQLQKQFDLLKKQNLLEQPILKYFYWSADYDPAYNNIQKVVVEQAVELQQKEKQQLLSIKQWSDFKKRVRQLYPSTIEIRPIVDQFNLIVSLMRRWNYYLSTNKIDGKEELPEIKKKEFQALVDNTLNRAKELSFDFNQFIRLGRTYGLNSSLSVQKELLQYKMTPFQSGDIYKKIGLELNTDWLQFYRIPYERQIETDRGKVDSWNIAWFEIWRRLKQSNKQESDLMRQEFVNVMKDKNASSFFRFVYLRKYLNIEEQTLPLNKYNLSNFTQNLPSIIQAYPTYCFKEEKKLFTNIFSKIQPWGKDSMLLMHEYAQMKVKNQQQRNNLAEFNLQIFKTTANAINNIDVQKNLENIIANKVGQPFPFHLENNGFLKLNWTFLQFYELSTHVLFPSVASSIFTGYSKFSKELLKKGAARGSSLQTAIIRSLTPGSILRYYVARDFSQDLNIAGRVGFIPFNSKLTINKQVSSKEMFKRNFNSLLSICVTHPYSSFLAIPQYKEHGIIRSSQTSLGIDFAIGMYNPEDKQFLIRTYDTTIEESPSVKVQQFNTKLFPQLSMLAKEGGFTSKDIVFEHIIPSLKKSSRIVIGESQNGFSPKIIQTNVNLLQVLKSTDQEATNALSSTLLSCQIVLAERRMFERLARAAK